MGLHYLRSTRNSRLPSMDPWVWGGLFKVRGPGLGWGLEFFHIECFTVLLSEHMGGAKISRSIFSNPGRLSSSSHIEYRGTAANVSCPILDWWTPYS